MMKYKETTTLLVVAVIAIIVIAVLVLTPADTAPTVDMVVPKR